MINLCGMILSEFAQELGGGIQPLGSDISD